MENSLTGCVGQFVDRGASCPEPDGSPHYRLDRLRELRAVIETLQRERASRDPLLPWIIQRESVEIHRRD